LSLHTTMDALAQTEAQRALRQAKPQGALVALDPFSGKVIALSGGKDFGESQFNRATQALRQPGSAFKPFVFGAALEKGFTPATVLQDEKKTFNDGKKGEWTPKNTDEVYHGAVSMREALSLSLNSATLDMTQIVR